MLTLQLRLFCLFVQNGKIKKSKQTFGQVTFDMDIFEASLQPNLHTPASIAITLSVYTVSQFEGCLGSVQVTSDGHPLPVWLTLTLPQETAHCQICVSK